MSTTRDTEPSPVTHEQPGGFSQTPLWVIMRCRQDVWLYDYLRARYGGLDAIFPSIKSVAEDFGISKDTVKRSLRNLEKAGALRRIVRYRKDGSQTSNEYRTLFYPPEERAERVM